MELLAKSNPRTYLNEHINDCLVIFRYLQHNFPAAAKIVSDINFWEVLRLAVIFHDLGKGHVEFYKLLNGEKDHQWDGQRHELFSLPFVDGLQVDEEIKKFLKLAIAAHHKDINTLNDHISAKYGSNPLGSREFEDEFGKVNVPKILSVLATEYQVELSNIKALSPKNFLYSYKYNKKELKDNERIKLLLLNGALKHCDHLGSAKVDSLSHLTGGELAFVENKVPVLYDHQYESSRSVGNTILISPTGSGKTESALLWLKKQLETTGQGRTFYVLPYTASINAMFERLKAELGEEKVGMLHGKLQEYLYSYLEDNSETVSKTDIREIRDRFKSIHTPLKVVTPFQLLKHLYSLKGFEQGMFEMAGAHLIFDEIHAYSPDTFAHIKFLIKYVIEKLQAKVFIMSATLPSFLQKELESITQFRIIKAAPSLYKTFNRHRVVIRQGNLRDIENIDFIKQRLEAGKKVLVVCNTVKNAQQVFKELSPLAENAVLLHSAFNGEDRSKQEQLLSGDRVNLLVGTQAIEVSLDIDYDEIFTEPAPIDALIQRFGRVNRKRKKGICPVYVFNTAQSADKYIYNEEIVSKTVGLLTEISLQNDGIIEEERLQEYVDRVYTDWNEKSKAIFDDAFENISHIQIIPLLVNEKAEEEFYKKFDGIKVLPVALKERYDRYILQEDIIGAERLKVQIRKRKFAQLIKEPHSLFSSSSATSKGKSIPCFIINKVYSPDLGLLFDEQEEWQTEIL
ncbi:CRISPR-associated endonuclease/helicase Cas3 [Chitinophaga terrae (ex Kim and Jung 2007)]|uniref:CRISPR-associated helicase Cas3' n=1 Tax=Chitinophaga terrae (ex Kim and Jung 2007) TaxID=408074 RepID=UPI002786A898|nr:CRISPR-associated helicase Cas3' [Chitinophaga terrae (ex Kim and Jung 2007)]MDQ0109941.1 CRISPR-associated endonuclease/helicase Cas3 [Chitinophaga terrae (ex Kim and Jung 2007)]